MRGSPRSSEAARRCGLAVALLLTWVQLPAAHGQAGSSAEIAAADKELNQTYQQLMQKLPPIARERLRGAERAWVAYTQLNNLAMQTAATRLAVPGEEMASMEANQMRMRSAELEVTAGRDSRPDAMARLKRADEELNVVYRRCIGELTPADVVKLREAQKAWVVFREASQPFGPEVCFQITGHRIDQLHDFYVRPGGSSSPGSAQRTARSGEENLDPTIPDPFERAR